MQAKKSRSAFGYFGAKRGQNGVFGPFWAFLGAGALPAQRAAEGGGVARRGSGGGSWGRPGGPGAPLSAKGGENGGALPGRAGGRGPKIEVGGQK